MLAGALAFLRGRLIQLLGLGAVIGIGALAIQSYRNAIEENTAAKIRVEQLENEIKEIRIQRSIETQELVKAFDAEILRQEQLRQSIEAIKGAEDGPAAEVLNRALEEMRK